MSETEHEQDEQAEQAEQEQPKGLDQESIENIKIKYKLIRDYCKDDEHFDNVIQDLVLLEVVTGQVNQIFCETIYNQNNNTLAASAQEAVDTLLNTFTLEFIDQTMQKEELIALPGLPIIIGWIEEIHTNMAGQLFTKDFTSEVLLPSFQNISEAISEVSGGEQSNVEDIEVTLPEDEADELNKKI